MHRWRKLPGKVPGKDELRARISYLHDRLDRKEDTLLEKRLILEEIASLSHRLRTQAAEGRQDTLELAQKVCCQPHSPHTAVAPQGLWVQYVSVQDGSVSVRLAQLML